MRHFTYHFFLFLYFFSFLANGQALENLKDRKSTLIEGPRAYTSSWIMHPRVINNDHAVVLFRRTFILEELPPSFIIHISADNRYRLFVNGVYAAKGPARSDSDHWYYETLDLTSLLKKGSNVLAVEVVNFGPKRAWSQFSTQTNLFVQGHSELESTVNSTPGNWLTCLNQGIHPKYINWISGKDVAFGLYVWHPTDSVVADKYPWGWEKADYDDTNWTAAIWSNNAGGRDTQYAGGINYPGGKLLVSRPVNLLKEQRERFLTIIRNEWIEPPKEFLKGERAITIPPHKKVLILYDQTYLTIGYPELKVSKGKGSTIRAGYAETLYNKDRHTKGNRNDPDNKIFIGINDVFLPDGSANRLFRPLSHRTFRFLQLEIETTDEALIIHDYYNMKVGYPLELEASFKSNDPEINALMEPGWRTVSLCAQDILMSDAYYEQMQYVGDCKVHNLAILYLSGNDDLVRNQLKQTDWSRIPEGLTLACYPNEFHLVIPYYSLVWIEMINDYMMWSGDHQFVRELEPGIHDVLEWFATRMEENGMLGPLEWWNYVDWSPGFPNGVPPGIENGQSALFSLEYANALQKASEICMFTGNTSMAENYNRRADKILSSVNEHCFDSKKGLYAETPEMKDFSQHTNILAILSGAVKEKEATLVMEKVLEDTTLHEVALFFRYYLLEALNRSGMVDQFKKEIQPWFEMITLGLTTFTEIPVTWERQRSDCHPWSTGPNIHFFKSLCGIKPLKPGYNKVEIKPVFAHLERIDAVMPHPKGNIEIHLTKNGNKAQGEIVLGDGMTGRFIYGSQEFVLTGGMNKIE